MAQAGRWDAADRIACRVADGIGIGLSDRSPRDGRQAIGVEPVDARHQGQHGRIAAEEDEGLHDLSDAAADGIGRVLGGAGRGWELLDRALNARGGQRRPHALRRRKFLFHRKSLQV